LEKVDIIKTNMLRKERSIDGKEYFFIMRRNKQKQRGKSL